MEDQKGASPATPPPSSLSPAAERSPERVPKVAAIGMDTLRRMLAAMPRSLNLENQPLDASSMRVILNALASLDELNLGNTKLNNRLIARLVDGLQDNKSVTKLSLSGNDLTDTSAESISTLFVAKDLALRALDISGNKIGNVGAGYIVGILTDDIYLVELDISDNPYDHTVHNKILEMVEKNFSLQYVSVNPMSDKSTADLVEALSYNRSLNFTSYICQYQKFLLALDDKSVPVERRGELFQNVYQAYLKEAREKLTFLAPDLKEAREKLTFLAFAERRENKSKAEKVEDTMNEHVKLIGIKIQEIMSSFGRSDKVKLPSSDVDKSPSSSRSFASASRASMFGASAAAAASGRDSSSSCPSTDSSFASTGDTRSDDGDSPLLEPHTTEEALSKSLKDTEEALSKLLKEMLTTLSKLLGPVLEPVLTEKLAALTDRAVETPNLFRPLKDESHLSAREEWDRYYRDEVCNEVRVFVAQLTAFINLDNLEDPDKPDKPGMSLEELTDRVEWFYQRLIPERELDCPGKMSQLRYGAGIVRMGGPRIDRDHDVMKIEALGRRGRVGPDATYNTDHRIITFYETAISNKVRPGKLAGEIKPGRESLKSQITVYLKDAEMGFTLRNEYLDIFVNIIELLAASSYLELSKECRTMLNSRFKHFSGWVERISLASRRTLDFYDSETNTVKPVPERQHQATAQLGISLVFASLKGAFVDVLHFKTKPSSEKNDDGSPQGFLKRPELKKYDDGSWRFEPPPKPEPSESGKPSEPSKSSDSPLPSSPSPRAGWWYKRH